MDENDTTKHGTSDGRSFAASAGSAHFLEHVRQIARYWAAVPGKSALEVANGTAFSILVALDGEAMDCGPYAVRPINEKGEEGEDIAGGLHDAFYAPNDANSPTPGQQPAH